MKENIKKEIFYVNNICIYTFDNTKVIVTYVPNKHPRIEISRNISTKTNSFYVYPEQLIKL